jgi:hypothetical protein
MPYDPHERFELDDPAEDVLKKLLGVTEDETENEERELEDEPEPYWPFLPFQ